MSSENARFSHPEYGVVNGKNPQLLADSEQCFKASQGQDDSTAEVSAAVAGVVAKEIGEDDVGNVLIAAALLSKGTDMFRDQAGCLDKLGWQRIK